jgi:nitroimidazol reductase NimA-like FMN-containing flavoprotein (pyridoxamine 5'-phosphate oxidase superfamily)
MSAQECLHLLADPDLHVGRLALILDDEPVILPVNFTVDRGVIVFRTETGSLLAYATRGAPVAFEVDKVDPAWREGWSVLVRGRGEHVSDPDELVRLRSLPLQPWAPGDKALFARIVPTAISGRRIT